MIAVWIGILFHFGLVQGRIGKAKIFAFLGIHNKRRVAVLKIWLFIINVGQGFRVWFTKAGLKLGDFL